MAKKLAGSKTINPYLTHKDLRAAPWMEQISTQLSSTQSVLRACVGWVVELGISPSMPFYQKRTLVMINASTFMSLIMALPGTLVLILMGFGHSFSLLIGGVLAACFILGLNGARRVEWSKVLYAYAPAAFVLAYTLLELPANGLEQPLNYLLARQGLCFALLVPILVYGFDGQKKLWTVGGMCLLALLVYDVGSMRRGVFEGELITGLSHGLFTVLSLAEYAVLAGCVGYMQNSAVQQARLAQGENEKLKRLAIRDGLTRLFNHSFMEQLIGDAINRLKRSGNPLAFLMIDVDSFKQVNDTFGHNAGDEVLVRLARLLNANKRSTDYLGRWGGDELVLLLTETDLAGADKLAEKLRALVENQVFPYGKRLTISLGVSQYQPGDSMASFIARADAAMYRAKRSGRNKVEAQAKASNHAALST